MPPSLGHVVVFVRPIVGHRTRTTGGPRPGGSAPGDTDVAAHRYVERVSLDGRHTDGDDGRPWRSLVRGPGSSARVRDPIVARPGSRGSTFGSGGRKPGDLRCRGLSRAPREPGSPGAAEDDGLPPRRSGLVRGCAGYHGRYNRP
jgi:hypothetical protein